MAVSRLRLYDLIFSDFPAAIGLCGSQGGHVANAVNRCQERLITCKEAGDTGWWGSYAEMVFNVSQTDPYITLPRGVARLIRVDACDRPIPINNQFSEFLAFGSGRWPRLSCSATPSVCHTGPNEVFRRNMACTQVDLPTPNYGLRFYTSSLADVTDGLRILVSGLDANGQIITTLDGTTQVNGCFATLAAPFADLTLPGAVTPLEVSAITGIQKDTTAGFVRVYAVELTTGAQVLILTLEPGETVAAYSRYYLNGLPNGCCPVPGLAGAVQVRAMVKLDLVPARVDTDYLLIQSREALIAEGKSLRFSEMDSPGASGKAADMHREAVRYLNGELRHWEGAEFPSITFAPFGHSRLSRQRIGTLM